MRQRILQYVESIVLSWHGVNKYLELRIVLGTKYEEFYFIYIYVRNVKARTSRRGHGRAARGTSSLARWRSCKPCTCSRDSCPAASAPQVEGSDRCVLGSHSRRPRPRQPENTTTCSADTINNSFTTLGLLGSMAFSSRKAKHASYNTRTIRYNR